MTDLLLHIPLWLRRMAAAAVVSSLALANISAGKIEPAPATANKPVVASVAPVAPAAQPELIHDLPATVVTKSSVIVPSAASHTRQIWMQVTAYCPCPKCCGPHAIGLTASGKDVTYNSGHFVAADTDHLPFGTKLIIPGYHDDQPVEVIDRGSAIKGDKLDVFFPTHEEALQWGRRWIAITVVE